MTRKRKLPLPRIFLNHTPSPIRMYGYKRVANLFGYSTCAIRRWHKIGKMPSPVKLPNGRVAWPEPILVEWIRSLEKAEA